MSSRRCATALLRRQFARGIQDISEQDNMIRDVKKRRRWKHLRYVIFAVLLLAMAAFVTVEVEIKGKKPDDCSCSNFWSILDSFYWKK